MPQTSDEKIARRLNDAKVNKSIKDSMYKLRRVVAGEYTPIGGDKIGVKYDNVNDITKANKLYATFRPAIYEEGVGNHLYEWIKILVRQITIQRARIDFPDLDRAHAKIRESYLNERLARNSWVVHEKKVLWHLLIDGIAWIKVGLFKDVPAMRSVDTLDLLWDLHADIPSETTFIAQEIRIKLDVAVEILGEGILATLPVSDKDRSGEDVIVLMEYWDTETLAYTTTDNFRILLKKDNPFRGFIPYIPLHGDFIPSDIHPMPHIVSVIGAQTAHAALQRSMNAMASKMKPQVFVDPAAFTPESYRMWQLNPDELTVLIPDRSYKSGETDPIRYIQPPRLTTDVLAWKTDLEAEIVRHMGVNPFAAGAGITPEFAAEVQEISARSGLNVASISADLATVLGDVFQRLIRIGALHDDEPFLTRMDGKLTRFEGVVPIKPLLEEDVPCMVKPASFETENEKLIKNTQLLAALNADPIMAKNTKLRKEFWANILSSAGFRDIDGLMTIEGEDQMLQLLEQVGITQPEQLAALIQQLQAPQQAQQSEAQQPALPEPQQRALPQPEQVQA